MRITRPPGWTDASKSSRDVSAATTRQTEKPPGLTASDPRRVYESAHALIASEAEAVDAVAVLTPTPSHAEIVARCLGADIPVICEKALAQTPTEAADLRNLAASRNAFLAVTYNYSGYPMVRELRRRIQSGALGRITQIHADMPQESFIRRTPEGALPTPQSWRLTDGPIPTLHLDLGVHLHQLIDYLTGLKPVEATAVENRFGGFDGIVDNVAATARYDGDVTANLWFSKSALGHRNGLELRIYGEKAAATWLQTAPETLHLAHADGRREILDRGGDAPIASAERYTRFKAGHPAGYVEAFANLYSDIADHLQAHAAGAPPPTDEVFGADLALEGLLFLETLTNAARERAWLRAPRPASPISHSKTRAA